MIKGKSQDGDNYKRESFIMRFNMGQNIYIGRGNMIWLQSCKIECDLGAFCPLGFLNIHNFIKKDKAKEDDSFESKMLGLL